MKNYSLTIFISIVLTASIFYSCVPLQSTGSFYGTIGTFSGEQGSHAQLVALLKSEAIETGKADEFGTGTRGIKKKSSAVSSSSNYFNNYAVVIGIDDYKYWPKLGNARNDAYAMEQLFKSMGFTVYSLYDRQATKDKIQSTLTDIIGSKANSNDNVVVFYAGHGYTLELDNGSSVGYIVPGEGKTDEYSSMISMTNLLDWSRIIKARKMLFIMDSCYSGTGKLTEIQLRDAASGSDCKSRQIITAGQKNQQVFDSTEGTVRHSVFTNRLISAIKETSADNDNDGLVNATELGEYLRVKVSAETKNKQIPDFGQLPGHKCGEYIFYSQKEEVKEANIYKYCDISPNNMNLESYKKFDIGGTINNVIFNPVYNDVVAIASSNKLFIWNIQQDKEVLSVNKSVTSIAFSPNGKSLVAADSSGVLTFYDVENGNQIYSINSPIRGVNSVAFGPKASRLALGGMGKVVVWDILANIQQPMAVDHNGNIHTLQFSGKSGLFSVSDNMTSKLWNLDNQQEIKRIDESSDMNELASAGFSEDGSIVALGLKQVNINVMKGTRTDFEYIRLRNTETSDNIWTFEGHTEKINSIAFHPNKQYFASGSADKEIKFWDVRDRNKFKVIPNNAPVDKVNFSPNGCWFAAASGGTVSIWKITEER